MKPIKLLPPYRMAVRCTNKLFPEFMARKRFKIYFGRDINYETPTDLNEKITWLSLYTDTSEWIKLADKYAVRKYVEDCGCGDSLVKLYGKWDTSEDIEWDILPESFVLKTNNGSGTVLIVRDKKSLNISETTKNLTKWMKNPVGLETTEFHYTYIKPCIIAEELLYQNEEEMKISTTLIDYKIWCFNGVPYCCWACTNRENGGADVASFDLDWNYHPEHSIFNSHYRKQNPTIKKPENFNKMLDIAKKLSAGFPILRVDLYNIDGKIYFGELTFTTLGGIMNFYTPDYLFEMGSLVDLTGIKKDRTNRPKW